MRHDGGAAGDLALRCAVGSPTTVGGDVLGPLHCMRLAQKPADGASIGQHQFADTQRGRNARHECAKGRGGQGPDLDGDAGAFEGRVVDQARLWRNRARQSIETIARRSCGVGQFHAFRSGQFVIQRHAGQMRTNNGNGQPTRRNFGLWRGGHRSHPVDPHTACCGGMHRAGEGGQRIITEAWPDQRDPCGQARRAEAARHRNRGQPHQVDEICIAPELAVPGNRVG